MSLFFCFHYFNFILLFFISIIPVLSVGSFFPFSQLPALHPFLPSFLHLCIHLESFPPFYHLLITSHPHPHPSFLPSFLPLSSHPSPSLSLPQTEIPEEKPTIFGTQHEYKIGDTARLTCVSAPSRPPAILSWYINDKMVSIVLSRYSLCPCYCYCYCYCLFSFSVSCVWLG